MNTFSNLLILLTFSITSLAITVSNTTVTSVNVSNIQNKAYGETITSLPASIASSTTAAPISSATAVLLNFTVSTTQYNASINTYYNSTSTAYQTINSTDLIEITSCSNNACSATSTLNAVGSTSAINSFDSTTTNTVQTTITVRNPVSTVVAAAPTTYGPDVSVFTSNGDVYIFTQVTSYVTGTNFQLFTSSAPVDTVDTVDTVPTYSYQSSPAVSSTLDATYAIESSYSSSNNTGIQFFGSASSHKVQVASIVCAFITLIMLQVLQ